MPKHFILLIIFTSIIGFATGIYGYFISRDTESIQTEIIEETGYEVLGTVYGGCERVGCVSYRLKDDGSYLYLTPQGVRDYARFEDTISDRQRERIDDLLRETPLQTVSESTFMGTCPVTYDGIAYRFEIRRESDRFSFDSCVEDLVGFELFIELTKYFAIMEAIHRPTTP